MRLKVVRRVAVALGIAPAAFGIVGAAGTIATLPSFEDVAAEAGVRVTHHNGASAQKHIVETMGSGALFFDFDRDGWLDLFVVDGGSVVDPRAAAAAQHRLFRNRGDGGFEDVTRSAGIGRQGYGMGACAADVDGDGWTDLYVTGFGPNALYRNSGRGTFTDVTATAGVGVTALSTSCAFADVDNDGDLDLYVVKYVDPGDNTRSCGTARVRAYCRPDVYEGAPSTLYRNDGTGVFTDVTRAAGLQRSDGKGLGVVFADYDDDGLIDLFVANDLTPNFLFHNEGNGNFKEVGLAAGVALASDGRARAGMGTDAGDYDGDGRLDLVVTNFESEAHSVFRNLGRGLFADATFHTGVGPATLPFLGFGALFLDYDNDTHLDLAIANGHVLDNAPLFRSTSRHAQRRLLFHNGGGGRFVEVGRQSGSAFASETVGRGLIAGDVDNDGDLDLFATSNGQPSQLLRNDGAGAGPSATVVLRGNRGNRDGIGAVAVGTVGDRRLVRTVKAGTSYLGQSDTRLHFGLGAASRIDRLEVRWPGGGTEIVTAIMAGEIVSIAQGKGVVERHLYARRQPPSR
jgi:enediyne biosynthesis protein E4